MNITLRPVTAANVKTVCKLQVEPEQMPFVAHNGQSLAEAQFFEHAWPRAIYADDQPVGFLMLSLDPAHHDRGGELPAATHQPRNADAPHPTHWKPFLWRFMVDREHQGRGYGRRAIELAIEHIRNLPNVHTFYTSYIKGEHGPEDFYLKLGFQPTGPVPGGEHGLRLDIQPPFDRDDDEPVLVDNPCDEEIAELDDRLDEFNRTSTGRNDFTPLRLVVRAADGGVIAGLKAVTGWDWLYIQTLWVDEPHRRSGWATRLLERAESEAKNRGCIGACLSTYSVQAPQFYERHGYETFGSIADYPMDATMLFFRKHFLSSRQSRTRLQKT